MSQTYYAILTAIGEAKLANAAALNVPLQISKMAVGDGNGVLPNPIRTQTALVHENYRADLNTLSIDPANASQIIAEMVIPETTGGWWLREMGLYDSAGSLIAVCNCPPSYKPQLAEGSGRTQVLRMILIVSSTSTIELKIDPSVVLATRAYVDQKMLEELNKLDFKFSVIAATTASVALNGLVAADGVAGYEGMRTLVWKQAQAKDNGIYLMSAGVWTRAPDADSSLEVTPGLFVHVEKGTLYGDSVFQLVTDAPIVLGTTDLAFESPIGRTGVGAGTYRSVTVDKYGRVVGGTNPATLAGYGIDPATQAEAEAQTDHDNAKPMTALRVFQAILKKLGLAAQTGLTDATIGKLMLVGSGGLMGPVEPFTDANTIPYRTGHFGASGAQILHGPPNATGGDPVFQEVFNSNAAAQHWTCYTVDRKYTRRWTINAWGDWIEDLTTANVATTELVDTGTDDKYPVTSKKLAARLTKVLLQATETVLGLAKVATATQVNAGADDATIVTPKKLRLGFVASLNTNGYIIFPSWMGSFIIQWTTSAQLTAGGTGSVSWPVAFTNTCLFGTAAAVGNAANSNAGNVVPGAVSVAGINLYNWGVIAAAGRCWAIGV